MVKDRQMDNVNVEDIMLEDEMLVYEREHVCRHDLSMAEECAKCNVEK
jgi:hypothetical protein